MENPCSIFVGSLSVETTMENLENYFSSYGPIESAVVLYDKVTNVSRGFGFVNFKTPESRTNALQSGPHLIDNKKVECKAAIRRGDQKFDPMPVQRQGGGGRVEHQHFDNQRKVFVGGISNGTSDDDIKIALSKFGSVETVEQKFDKVSQRMRGFGFVEFSCAKEAQDAVHAQFIQINGKTVEIKIAENRQPQYGQSAGGSYSTGSFGNNIGMYAPPFSYGGYSQQGYTGSAGNTFGAGGATGYMGNNPNYGGSAGYGTNSQYQSYAGKDGGNPYGGGNAYNTSSGFSGGSGYGGASGSGYSTGSGYGRGAYHPYGQ